jgi:hypothetical protein
MSASPVNESLAPSGTVRAAMPTAVGAAGASVCSGGSTTSLLPGSTRIVESPRPVPDAAADGHGDRESAVPRWQADLHDPGGRRVLPAEAVVQQREDQRGDDRYATRHDEQQAEPALVNPAHSAAVFR